MEAMPNWVEKLNVQPGDHILAIVTNEEERALLPPYASDGFAKGNLCNVFGKRKEMDALRQYLRDFGIPVDERERSGRLTFGDTREMGRNAAGQFDRQLLERNLEHFAASLRDQNIHHLRCMGSMSWLIGTTCANDGIYLCARMNEIFKGRPVSGL